MGKRIGWFAGLCIGISAASIGGGAVWGQFQIPRLPNPRVPNTVVVPAPPKPREQRPPRQEPQPPAPSQTEDRPDRVRDRANAQNPTARPRNTSSLPTADQGILNDLHRANIGKIVFTRQDMLVDAIKATDFVDDFDLGQPMFFRVYMAKSAVNEMLGRQGVGDNREMVASRIQYRARFTINGQSFDTTFHYFGEIAERNRYTTWRGQFINRHPFAQRTPGSEVLREFVTKGLSKGLLRVGTTSQVKMEIIPMVNPFEGDGPPIVGEVVASGTFNLRVTSASISRTDPHICIPQGERNAAIERQALAQARPSWLARDAQPVAARLGLDAWEVTRNSLTSVPIERKTTVLIVARNPEYCYSAQYSWTEPFAGNGFSTASGSLAFLPFTRTYFPCSCLD